MLCVAETALFEPVWVSERQYSPDGKTKIKMTKLKPEKKPGELAGNTGRGKLARVKYTILKAMQRPFLRGFWALEQRIARLEGEAAR